jgi:hypothetical protein
VAAARAGHAYVGIDQQASYLELTRLRLLDEQPAWAGKPRLLRLA